MLFLDYKDMYHAFCNIFTICRSGVGPVGQRSLKKYIVAQIIRPH